MPGKKAGMCGCASDDEENMKTKEEAEQELRLGEKFPYDGGADFWEECNVAPPPAVDKAHAAARGVLADLLDRRAIKHALEEVDHEVRKEITESLANIIRVATTGAPSVEAARKMGEVGGPTDEAERLAFEAWMSGHNWDLGGSEWDGEGYRSKSENKGFFDLWATHVRRCWAAWRDRAALSKTL